MSTNCCVLPRYFRPRELSSVDGDPLSGQLCRPSPAFTLLEILVVVAIIALLVAVLLPTLAAARQRARHAQCQANLSQITRAWHAYLSVSAGRFLKSETGFSNRHLNYGGKQGIAFEHRGPKPLNRFAGLPEITQGGELFHCPLDTGARGYQPSFFEHCGTSYRMNHILVGAPNLSTMWINTPPCSAEWQQVSDRMPNLDAAEIRGDSRLVLVGDASWYYCWERVPTMQGSFWWHHRPEYHNLAFMDGHVGFVRIEKGMHVRSSYTVIPFSDLQTAIWDCQPKPSSQQVSP